MNILIILTIVTFLLLIYVIFNYDDAYDYTSNVMPEIHLINFIPIERYSFCGPFTKTNKRLHKDYSYKHWSRPINRLDHLCYEHDVEYTKSSLRKNRNIADKKFKDELEYLKNNTSGNEYINCLVLSNILKMKKL